MHPFGAHKAQAKCKKEMASMKLLSLTCILLLSGLVVLGEIKGTEAVCEVLCIQGGFITCDNYPGKELDGCDCDCAPKDGKNCVLHLEHGPPSNCKRTEQA